MVVDNFDIIEKILDFDNIGNDEFYPIYIARRTKDQSVISPTYEFNTIKTYYISSFEKFERKKDEIKKLCEFFNARAYIDPNKRKRTNFLLKLIEIISHSISINSKVNFDSIFEMACKHTKTEGDVSKWLVDIDTKDKDKISEIKDFVKECGLYGEDTIICEIPTLHGVHLIIKPIYKNKFFEKYGNSISVFEYSFALLYYKDING